MTLAFKADRLEERVSESGLGGCANLSAFAESATTRGAAARPRVRSLLWASSFDRAFDDRTALSHSLST